MNVLHWSIRTQFSAVQRLEIVIVAMLCYWLGNTARVMIPKLAIV